ncbi:MAG TPA: hypothetical protein VG501_06855, partial [Rhizomicrobium sp.]|nr:hypothetical protein [Rhizomicrobium sp.]
MRIAVHSENKRAIDAAVSAAKLHVLDLEPIKAQVGEKWPRLSDLVHALFERALKRTQGPLDRFLPAGELAYVVTFHGRSGEEAEIMCRAVAWEVCELLFGEGAGDISVRCVVGTLPLSQLSERSDAGMLADLLEKTGGETLVSKTAKPRLFSPRYPAEFFPFWDLERGTSSFLFLTPILVGQRRQATSFRRMLAPPAPQQTEEDNIAELEIRLLQAAGGYAERVQAAGKVCAIAAGVSWETLSVLHTRIRYITALKSIVPQPNCPLLVKIQDVPIGILLGRLAEMTAMLSRIGVRVL